MVMNYEKINKAIVIGATNLCIQCIKHLIDNNWQVAFVISDDKNVILWAKEDSSAILSNSQLDEIKGNQKKEMHFF